MKWNFIFQTLLLIVFQFSCTPEEPNVSNTDYSTRLWRKLFYSNLQDTIPNRAEYYRYDSHGRMEKICFSPQNCPDTLTSMYVILNYNASNQLLTKITYALCCEEFGWVTEDSTSYHYDNNFLFKEEQFFPISPVQNYWEINYEYEDSLLKKKFNYYNGYLQNWVLYEYADSLCTKETVFKDLAATKIEYSIYHFYQDRKKIRSEYFDPNYIFSYEVINYAYNKVGDLVLEECNVNPEWVWPASYVYRYEYEKITK
jgi:hypothetical protein